MVKFKTSVLLISSLLIVAITAALTYFALSASGVIDAGKIEIVIQIEDNEKEYDGTPLYANSFSIISGELADTHELLVTYTSSQTNVGRSAALATARVVNENMIDVSNDYNIKIKEGILAVTSRPIRISVKNVEKIYDGTPITGEDIEIKEGALVAGHIAQPNFTVVDANINAGQYLCNVTASIVNLSGEDVTSNYTIASDTGILTINQAPLVIRSKSVAVEFSSNIHAEFGYEVLSGSLIGSDYIGDVQFEDMKASIGNNTIKISNVGILNRNGEDVTNNYYIVVQNTGILTVNRYILDLTVVDNEFVYNGEEQSSDEFTVDTVDNAYLEANEFTVEASSITKQKDAGTVSNKLDFKVYDSSRTNITDCFVINQTTGILTINKAKINVEFEEVSEYAYDGEIKSPTVKFVYNNTEYNDQIDYQLKYASAEGTYFTDLETVDAGSYIAIVFSASFKEESEELKNFEIEVGNYISYTIKPAEVELEWDSIIEYTYNGQPQHSVFEDFEVIEGDDVAIEYSCYASTDLEFTTKLSSVDVGKYKVIPRFTGLDVKNYDFKYDSYAEYDIIQEEVELEWNVASSYIYNGTAQHPTIDKYISPYDDDLSFKYSIKDSKSNESESINSDSYSIELIISGASAKNYKFDYEEKLDYQIEPLSIELEWYETDYTYNGAIQHPTIKEFTGIINNDDISLSYTVTGDNDESIAAGNYTITLDITGDSIGNYDFNGDEYKEYSIKKKDINVLISDVYELQFTGSDYEIDIMDVANTEGLATDHRLGFAKPQNVTIDEIIKVAELKPAIDNPITRAISVVVLDAEGIDVSKNYNFNETDSKIVQLKYTKPSVIFTGGYISKVYDGTPILLGVGEEMNIPVNNNEENYARMLYFDIHVTGEIPSHCTVLYDFDDEDTLESDIIGHYASDETADVVEVEFTPHIFLNSSNRDISSLFNIKTINGTQEILPKDLSISLGNYTKQYDGTSFTINDVYPTIVGAVNDDYENIYNKLMATIAIDDDISATEVGTYEITGSCNNGNYSISFNNGSLTITKAKITVKALSYVMTYSGEVFDDIEIIVDDPTNELSSDDFEVDASYTDVGTYKLIPASKDTIDTDTYDLDITPGTLTITPKPVTISLGTYIKTYDGLAFGENNVNNVIIPSILNSDDGELNISEFEYSNVGVYTIEATHTYSDNFDVTIIPGTLTITPKPVTISLGTYTKVYSEDPFTPEDVTNIVIPSILNNDSGELIISNFEYYDVDTYTIEATHTYSDNFDVTIVPGSVTITPKKMEIIIKDYAREYVEDLYFTADDVIAVIPDELSALDNVEGLNIPINVTDAGAYTIHGTADYGNNYDVNVVPGTLTIVPVAVMVSMESMTVIKGTSISEDDVTLTYNRDGFKLDDFTISCTDPDFDFDNATIGVYVINIEFNAKDYYPNYYVIGVPGTLTVIL